MKLIFLLSLGSWVIAAPHETPDKGVVASYFDAIKRWLRIDLSAYKTRGDHVIDQKRGLVFDVKNERVFDFKNQRMFDIKNEQVIDFRAKRLIDLRTGYIQDIAITGCSECYVDDSEITIPRYTVIPRPVSRWEVFVLKFLECASAFLELAFTFLLLYAAGVVLALPFLYACFLLSVIFELFFKGQPGVWLLLNCSKRRYLTWLTPCLLALGASIASRDKQGRNVLHAAALSGDAWLIQLLHEKDSLLACGLDVYRKTPLHYAVQAGRLEATRTLVECWANTVGNRDVEGKKPIDRAIERNNLEIVRMLLEKEDFEGLRTGGFRRMLAHVFTEKLLDVARVLLDYRAERSIPVCLNKMLTFAAKHEQSEAISLLLEYGAELNGHNGDNHTPLYYALLDRSSGGRMRALALAQRGALVNDAVRALFLQRHDSSSFLDELMVAQNNRFFALQRGLCNQNLPKDVIEHIILPFEGTIDSGPMQCVKMQLSAT